MENSPVTTINEVLNTNTFSGFTIKLTAITSLLWFLGFGEICSTIMLAPYLMCQWNLGDYEEPLLSIGGFLGYGFGATFFGRISDVYGRKLPMFLAVLFVMYFSVLASISEGLTWYIILRFFVGIGAGGAMVTSSTLISEYTGSKHRGKITMATAVICSLGNLYMGLIAYLTINVHGWRIFLLFLAIPALVALVCTRWLPESIRYLQVSDNREGILDILYWICKQNKKNLPPKIDLDCRYVSTRGYFWLLVSKRFRRKTFLYMTLWVIIFATYYATKFLVIYNLQQGLDNCDVGGDTDWHYKDFTRQPNKCLKLSSSVLLGNILMMSSELPGAILYLIIVDIIGRKACLVFGFVYLSVVYTLQTFCLPSSFSLVLLFSGHAVAYGLTGVIFISTAETFPTHVRSMELGICNTVSRWFLVFIPYLFQNVIYTSVFMVTAVFVTMNVVGCLLCCCLTETRGKELE